MKIQYKFNPVSDKCIISKDKPREKTLGGIIKPDMSRKVPCTGRILGIGPGSQRRTAGSPQDMKGIKVGDKVLFLDHEGFNFKLNGESFLSVPIRFILTTISNDDFELD